MPNAKALWLRQTEAARIALVGDVRGREFLPDFARVVAEMRHGLHEVRVVFLDASDDILLRRFSETRRKHPLSGRGGAREAIRRERGRRKPSGRRLWGPERRRRAPPVEEPSGGAAGRWRRRGG